MQYRCITTHDNDTSRAYNSARQVDTYVGMHVTPTFFLRQTHGPVRYSQSFANDIPLPLKFSRFRRAFYLQCDSTLPLSLDMRLHIYCTGRRGNSAESLDNEV